MIDAVYQQALGRLYSLRQFGMKPGLENPRRLMALLGNPQLSLRFIHVAGTNGKGSTCAFLESIYRHSGLKVGLFTSPHLVHFGERIQIQRQRISEEDIVSRLDQAMAAAAQFPEEDPLTFFEIVTAMALLQFQVSRCDLVIWETGLGGRLDATNVVIPIASVITSIGLDHQDWLGDTLSKIASEKAGIIKPGVTVVACHQSEEVDAVISLRAQELNAPMCWVSDEETQRLPIPSESLPLPGLHQHQNASLAVATVRSLQSVIPVAQLAIEAGLRNTRWAGRFQRRVEGETTWVLDGAHNPDGVRSFLETLRKEFPNRKPSLIVGILQDKSWCEMARALAACAAHIRVVPVSNDRTVPLANLAAEFRATSSTLDVIECTSLQQAIEQARQDPLVAIVGSLYLVGEAVELLGLAESGSPSERHICEGPSNHHPHSTCRPTTTLLPSEDAI